MRAHATTLQFLIISSGGTPPECLECLFPFPNKGYLMTLQLFYMDNSYPRSSYISPATTTASSPPSGGFPLWLSLGLSLLFVRAEPTASAEMAASAL
ncbi:hypothetical protein BGY98DRAFT_1099999 [Russula aff. rugulosa BPL654]|nr:hypothetical protein BGY98DRAFT_1099999 [Russula aff. rugulosa BPL654]